MKHLPIKILLLIVAFLQISYQNIAQEKPDFKIRKIVIDAGHGGKDSGALGSYSKEKDLTLSLALKFGEYIEKNMPEIEVIYTRKTDVFVELYKRAKIANDAKADLFISIHINAAGSKKAHGTETYAMGLHVSKSNLAVAKKENSVIMYEDDYETNYEGFDPNSPESHIMFSMYQNAYLDQSLLLAANMQDQFTNRVGRHNRGVRQAGFWVLHKVAMPSILIEAGFITNPEEEKFLNSDEGIAYMSSAMYRAFKDYKKAFEADNEADVLTDEATKTESKIPSFPEKENNSADANIVFRVQIGTGDKPCENLKKKYPDVDTLKEYYHMGAYKHTAGETSDYNKILKLQNQLKDKYKGCFVVAFKNNQRIDVNQARKALGQ